MMDEIADTRPVTEIDIEALKIVDEAYQDRTGWIKKSIRTTAKMGKFSSDRAIQDYAQEYWNIESIKVE